MERWQDSSEIKEAAQLFGELFSSDQAARANVGPSREERLARALRMMCQRSGFSFAAVVDERGLPLAVHGDQLTDNAIGAVVTIASEGLTKIGGMVDEWSVEHVSFDIGFAARAVIRAFTIGEQSFYLMLICRQDIDERSEVELSIDAITAIISDS